MNIGKQTRLNRLFAHASRRLCSVAVDHYINYGEGIPPGLRDIANTLRQIVAGEPDAITMHRGIVLSAWKPFAGKVPFILQSSIVRPDDSCAEQVAEPEEALLLGADAFAVAGFVRGETEGRYLRILAENVGKANRLGMPVVAHMYPRRFGKKVEISHDPDDVAWAVRCAAECGADIVKTPYCNDTQAFGQIAAESPVPVVAAGGPRSRNFLDALRMLQCVVRSGAAGATIGRNVWGCPDIAGAVRAVNAVIHDGKSPEEAIRLVRSHQSV